MDTEVRLVYCDVCQDTVEICEETEELVSLGCHSFDCPFEGFEREDGEPKPLDFNEDIPPMLDPWEGLLPELDTED